MAKRVYFAFHYQNDIWRVNQVRNSDITKKDRELAGFYDHSLWEESKKNGDLAIKRMINNGLNNTSVTVILNGSMTYQRRWVRYEIVKSLENNNGLIVIDINKLKNSQNEISSLGNNPLDFLGFNVCKEGTKIEFYEYQNYNWIKFNDLPEIQTNLAKEYWNKFYTLAKFGTRYNWIDDNGYENFGNWVETACKK